MDYITQKKIEYGEDIEGVHFLALEKKLRKTLKLIDLEIWIALAYAEDRVMFINAFFYKYPLNCFYEDALMFDMNSLAERTGYEFKRKRRSMGRGNWIVKRYRYKECKQFRIDTRKKFFGE